MVASTPLKTHESSPGGDDAEKSAFDADSMPAESGLSLQLEEISDSADHSSSEIVTTTDDQKQEEEPPTESELETEDPQEAPNKATDTEEQIKDENEREMELPSERFPSDVDTPHAENDAATNNGDGQGEIIDEPRSTDAGVVNDETFVSVELSSSPTKVSSTQEMGVLKPFSEKADETMTSLNNESKPAPSSFSISHQPTITRRRKILHHPIISRLSKLPWDRLSNAGSACDLLFNCKYSVKQVEDEVREECRRGVSGDGVYIEDVVGREDGYVNVSLNYQYPEEGCEVEDFQQIVGCCSMLDNDEDTDDEEDMECVSPDKDIASRKVLEGQNSAVDANQEGEDEEREYSDDNRVNSSRDELHLQQQSEKNWKQSNPSLDMMLYRQFLND